MSISTKNIYCISGLGADERAFERLNINGCSLKYLKWVSPEEKETVSSYASKMLDHVTEPNPVIIGLSFGGMIAIEMAKKIEMEKLILISTAKTRKELPTWMRITGILCLHKMIPIKSNRFTEKADDRRIGIETIEEKKVVEAYRKSADQKHVNWGVDQILNWENNWLPENFYHIHGEDDRMFPIRNIQPTHIIKKGTHIMILNRADEISACIEQILLSK